MRGYAVSLSGRKRFFTLDELKARRGEADVVVGEYWKKD